MTPAERRGQNFGASALPRGRGGEFVSWRLAVRGRRSEVKGEEGRAKDEAYFTLHMCGCHAENADGRRKTADSTRVGGLARTLKGRNRMGRTIVFIELEPFLFPMGRDNTCRIRLNLAKSGVLCIQEALSGFHQRTECQSHTLVSGDGLTESHPRPEEGKRRKHD